MTDGPRGTGGAGVGGKAEARARWWPALVVAGLLGVFVGSAGYTFQYAEGLSYLSDDPTACVNCHVMRENYDGWRHASHHANATCNDCHVPHGSAVRKYWVKAEHGYRHSKGFTFNDFEEPIRMKASSRAVVVENCMRCHETIAADLTASDRGPGGRGGGHGGWFGGEDEYGVSMDCLHCHARVGHGPRR